MTTREVPVAAITDSAANRFEHLLSYDDTRKVFLGAEGAFDASYRETRKESSARWPRWDERSGF